MSYKDFLEQEKELKENFNLKEEDFMKSIQLIISLKNNENFIKDLKVLIDKYN